MSKITVDPNIHFGKPCVAGTRIKVQDVLELVKAGVSFDTIIYNYYPDLTTDDIEACLQFAIALVASEDFHLLPDAA
jgi:uncharacterized protein (DUF433 family)